MSKINQFEKGFDGDIALVLTCAKGMEELLASEILDIASKLDDDALSVLISSSIKVEESSVNLKANLSFGYRLCLWSRLAEQVLILLEVIELRDPKDLYEQAKHFPWEKVFSFQETFKVEVSARDSIYRDERYAALVLKDAVADRFRECYDKRPSVDGKNPDVILNVFVKEDVASLGLNLSGERLHKRSYRKKSVDAPLKESLAAALLYQMAWHKEFEQFQYFLDPFAGSGTIAVEALLMAADIAPNLFRERFGFENQRFYQAQVWQMIKAEAEERRMLGLNNLEAMGLKFLAFDSSSSAIAAMETNIQSLDLGAYIHIERRPLSSLQSYFRQKLNQKPPTCFVLSNPPYGGRLDDAEELKYLYGYFGDLLNSYFAKSKVGLISDKVELLDRLRFNSFEQSKFFNGNLSCHFRIRTANAGNDQKAPANLLRDVNLALNLEKLKSQGEIDENAIPFANRLVKNLKQLGKWSRQEQVACFRLYDADIPEFNAAVDIYEDALYIAEYAAPKKVDEEKAKYRFNLIVTTARELFQLKREQVFLKKRKKQKGDQQYEKKSKKGQLKVVHEGGLNFLINLTDYLDTGLFIDHRLIRKEIQSRTKGKRVLNLFAYTGSVSVYAASGGANKTVSVDLSANYMSWARKNLMANGFSLENNETVSDDCVSWLKNCKDQFDLIFIDPPTFSNSKKKNLVFDIQSDHLELIANGMRRLDEDGVLIFSNNFKRFELHEILKQRYDVEEISARTLSPDFAKSRHMHRAWLFKNKK